MGLENVKQQIVSDASAQAELLQKEAESEVKAILDDAKAEIEKYKESVEQNQKKLLETAKRKEISTAEFEGRKLVLEAKSMLISKVIGEAQKKLVALPEAKKKKLMSVLLAKAKSEADIAVVYTNKKDKSYISGAKEKPITGGLVAETSDGRISIDLSFEEILRQVKEKYFQELSEVLFGGE